jgi:hypothetical protein
MVLYFLDKSHFYPTLNYYKLISALRNRPSCSGYKLTHKSKPQEQYTFGQPWLKLLKRL